MHPWWRHLFPRNKITVQTRRRPKIHWFPKDPSFLSPVRAKPRTQNFTKLGGSKFVHSHRRQSPKRTWEPRNGSSKSLQPLLPIEKRHKTHVAIWHAFTTFANVNGVGYRRLPDRQNKAALIRTAVANGQKHPPNLPNPSRPWKPLLRQE